MVVHDATFAMNDSPKIELFSTSVDQVTPVHHQVNAEIAHEINCRAFLNSAFMLAVGSAFHISAFMLVVGSAFHIFTFMLVVASVFHISALTYTVRSAFYIRAKWQWCIGLIKYKTLKSPSKVLFVNTPPPCTKFHIVLLHHWFKYLHLVQVSFSLTYNLNGGFS